MADPQKNPEHFDKQLTDAQRAQLVELGFDRCNHFVIDGTHYVTLRGDAHKVREILDRSYAGLGQSFGEALESALRHYELEREIGGAK